MIECKQLVVPVHKMMVGRLRLCKQVESVLWKGARNVHITPFPDDPSFLAPPSDSTTPDLSDKTKKVKKKVNRVKMVRIRVVMPCCLY